MPLITVHLGLLLSLDDIRMIVNSVIWLSSLLPWMLRSSRHRDSLRSKKFLKDKFFVTTWAFLLRFLNFAIEPFLSTLVMEEVLAGWDS